MDTTVAHQEFAQTEEAGGVHFLMRRMNLSPDGVTFRNDMRVKWMQEVNLEAFRLAPHVLFGDKPLAPTQRTDDSISFDLVEWFQFFVRVASIFRDDAMLRLTVARSIEDWLAAYEHRLSEAEHLWDTTQSITPTLFKELFDFIAAVDAFAVFNMLLPSKAYQRLFDSIGIPEGSLSVDDFLVSLVVPHRNQVRLAKLQLALELQQSGNVPDEKLQQICKEILPYDGFDIWCFDDIKLTDTRIILRELRDIASKYSIEEIQSELHAIQAKRKGKLEARANALTRVAQAADHYYQPHQVRNILEALAFLAVVTTEEECRHMLETRHCVLIGRVARVLQLDVARANVDDMVRTARYFWKEI